MYILDVLVEQIIRIKSNRASSFFPTLKTAHKQQVTNSNKEARWLYAELIKSHISLPSAM